MAPPSIREFRGCGHHRNEFTLPYDGDYTIYIWKGQCNHCVRNWFINEIIKVANDEDNSWNSHDGRVAAITTLETKLKEEIEKRKPEDSMAESVYKRGKDEDEILHTQLYNLLWLNRFPRLRW